MDDSAKLKIEYVSINSIKPYKNNAKLHPEKQVDQIKKSIKDYGMNDPIGIWKDEIVEGHGRFEACKELGFTTIPIIRLDRMTNKQRKEYMLVHNKTTMNSGFDFELLDTEIADLLDFDAEYYEFDVSGEFDEAALDELFEDAEPKEKESKQIQCPRCGEWIDI